MITKHPMAIVHGIKFMMIFEGTLDLMFAGSKFSDLVITAYGYSSREDTVLKLIRQLTENM